MPFKETQAVVDRFLGYDYTVLAEDAVGVMVDPGLRAVGPQAIEAMAHALYHDTFEAVANVRNVVIGESHGVVELDFVGTHRGEFCGIAGTGRKVNVPAVAIYDIAGGRMTGLRFYLPVNLILEQVKHGHD